MKTSETYIKPFTKEWWENYWYYYKWHTILIGLVIIAVAILIADVFGKPTPDFAFMYAGNHAGMGSVEGYTLEDQWKEYTSDVDGNGEYNVKSTVIYIPTEEAASVESAMGVVLDSELIAGESTVFFASEYLLGRFPPDEMEDLSAYVEKFNIDETLVKRNKAGGVYAVSMSQNPIFTTMEGVDPSEMYMLVRPVRETVDTSDYKKNLHKNGLEMAQHILSGGSYIPEKVIYEK